MSSLSQKNCFTSVNLMTDIADFASEVLNGPQAKFSPPTSTSLVQLFYNAWNAWKYIEKSSESDVYLPLKHTFLNFLWSSI